MKMIPVPVCVLTIFVIGFVFLQDKSVFAYKLSDNLQSDSSKFVSQRVDKTEENTSSQDSYGRPKDSETRDMNAGSYHIITSNYLGLPSALVQPDPGASVSNMTGDGDADLYNVPTPKDSVDNALERDMEGHESKTSEFIPPTREPESSSEQHQDHEQSTNNNGPESCGGH